LPELAADLVRQPCDVIVSVGGDVTLAEQRANALLGYRAPERLQQLADFLTARDLASCGEKWLTRFTPFFTARERTDAGCRHRLFFAFRTRRSRRSSGSPAGPTG
jgi:hypothetical protein